MHTATTARDDDAETITRVPKNCVFCGKIKLRMHGRSLHIRMHKADRIKLRILNIFEIQGDHQKVNEIRNSQQIYYHVKCLAKHEHENKKH